MIPIARQFAVHRPKNLLICLVLLEPRTSNLEPRNSKLETRNSKLETRP